MINQTLYLDHTSAFDMEEDGYVLVDASGNRPGWFEETYPELGDVFYDSYPDAWDVYDRAKRFVQDLGYQFGGWWSPVLSPSYDVKEEKKYGTQTWAETYSDNLGESTDY